MNDRKKACQKTISNDDNILEQLLEIRQYWLGKLLGSMERKKPTISG
ncbi:MAG: hypothetical protein JO327_01850 [Nitrososphaeraceae archaeon]|nr:hypothetical protein [Nitrososphaeraceae archaeon]MBV9666853.1 hypothetical protein [Nitrososphaeraceae archaeon]